MSVTMSTTTTGKDLDDIQHPAHLLCPISQQLMTKPVTFEIDGHKYTFDQYGIEAWMTTPNGDMNPLTMKSGLKAAKRVDNDALETEIRDYKISLGINPDQESVLPKIEPFSDFQQILDDGAVAQRLHRELNGPPNGVYVLVNGAGIASPAAEPHVMFDLPTFNAFPNSPARWVVGGPVISHSTLLGMIQQLVSQDWDNEDYD